MKIKLITKTGFHKKMEVTYIAPYLILPFCGKRSFKKITFHLQVPKKKQKSDILIYKEIG
jgi:hypothetical protein